MSLVAEIMAQCQSYTSQTNTYLLLLLAGVSVI